MYDTETIGAIIALIGAITQPELAYIIGISDTEAGRTLKQLEQSGRIRRDGYRDGWLLWKPNN